MDEAVAILKNVSTATITSILLKKGLPNVWMRGPRSIRPDQERMVGPAFTLRFIPTREDLANLASLSSSITTRTAIEAMPEGCVVVADALGNTSAAVVGDILCARMVRRKVAGIVTDGAIRDMAGILDAGLPVWCQGAAAPPSVTGLTFINWQEPVGCGGVAVIPGDIVVADGDGAVIIPLALLEDVLIEAPEQEQLEAWILDQVNEGASLLGLYPINEEAKARYEKSKRK